MGGARRGWSTSHLPAGFGSGFVGRLDGFVSVPWEGVSAWAGRVGRGARLLGSLAAGGGVHEFVGHGGWAWGRVSWSEGDGAGNCEVAKRCTGGGVVVIPIGVAMTYVGNARGQGLLGGNDAHYATRLECGDRILRCACYRGFA